MRACSAFREVVRTARPRELKAELSLQRAVKAEIDRFAALLTGVLSMLPWRGRSKPAVGSQ